MSIPAYFILYKEGRRIAIDHDPIVVLIKEEDRYKCWANASPLVRTGLDHIHDYLPELKRKYDFDGVQSSIDGKIFYLTHEGFVANEIMREDK